MANVKVTPRSLTDAYKRREGDFAPNLVGLQFTDGVSLFTFGNFQITANVSSKLNKNFVLGGQWSDYYNLDNLNLTENESEIILSNDIFVKLNFNPFNISRYVYFGSFYEYTRVTLENIIQSWKGSLYLDPNFNTNTVNNTVLSFSHNIGDDTTTFLIPKSIVINNFQLEVDDNYDYTDIPPSEIYNLSRDYRKYVIWNKNTNKEFPIIGYTGSTDSYQYLSVKTKGNPFPSLTATTFGQISYHVKPNPTEVQLFFEQLPDFEKILLNRLTTPIYTASFEVPIESDGVVYTTTKSFTWPVSDGYNLDISTRDYASYVENLLDAVNNFDSYKTDLVSRRFVSESIHEFDTNGGTSTKAGDETYGMKISKLLRIYGREFDEVKKYIDGISFANIVTYDKLDNTSDELIKMIAKNLGFDVLLTVGTDNFDLKQSIQPSFETPFSGYSRSLSTKELDIELWRRLVINAWWLWKSKGTRKVIEFFFNLFKINQCMITLDEYVYLAENRLDLLEVYNSLTKIFETDVALSDYPIDNYGFPKIPVETNENYFQMDGFWYNGGSESTIGNNPHIGPYDFGKNYFNQFECFVPNFNDFRTGSTLVTVNKNYFNNYNKGTFIFDQNGLPVPYYGVGYANVLNNGLVTNAFVNDAGLTYVGGNNSPNYGVPSGDTYSMKISFTAGSDKKFCETCSYNLIYGEDGVVYVDNGKPLDNQICCQNYWLPTVTNKVMCPDISSLKLSENNTIIDTNTNQTIPQDCCSKSILDVDVAWDGKGCILVKREQVVTVRPNVEKEVNTYSSKQLFTKSTTKTMPVEEVSLSHTCYWCPPKEYTQKICSADDYLAALTQTEITQLAVNLGWDNVGDPQTFISKIYSPFFNTYGCFLLDVNDKQISNRACCKLRGGTWTLIGNSYKCMVPAERTCGKPDIKPETYVWFDSSNNTLVSKQCCTQNNQYWVEPIGDSNCASCNIMLTSGNQITTFLDEYGTKVAQSNSYCSACPNNLVEVVESGYVFILEKSSNTNLSKQCCIGYGFTWNTTLNKCTKCPQSVQYGTTTESNVIVDLAGNDLSQQCCESVGGWYGNFYNNGSRCYICPGTVIYDSFGNKEINTNYQIIGNEVIYQGSSLSQQCCDNYNTSFGGVEWSPVENKCLVNIPCPPLPAFILSPSGDSWYNAPNYSFTGTFGGFLNNCGDQDEQAAENGYIVSLAYRSQSITDETCCNNIKNDTYNTGVSNFLTVSWDPNTNLCRVCKNG